MTKQQKSADGFYERRNIDGFFFDFFRTFTLVEILLEKKKL